MKNIKLTIEYEGTKYHGWQIQNNAVTVQGVLKRAIHGLTGEDINLIGCSRTDVGVHALGQVANFTTESSIPPDRFSYALNRMLPEDIVIKDSREVSLEFHARYCSKGKTYKYLFYNSQFPSALLRNRTYHVSHGMDVEAMQEAAYYFIGKHDFAAFMAAGSDVKTTERTITELVFQENKDTIEMTITGDGFLYNMVRIIAGTLVEVGAGKLMPGEIPDIIESRSSKRAGRTAPSQGLYLVEIYY